MEIEKLAKLAKINLSSEEKERFQKEFEAILGYISVLNDADDKNTENNFSKNKTINEIRADENGHEAEKFTTILMKDAPLTENGYVKVKHIFE